MLRDHLGEAVFYRSIRDCGGVQRFKITSWQQLQKMFEIIPGKNLQRFFTQWLERVGTPTISISEARSALVDSGYGLSITPNQSAPTYELRIPVAIQSQERTDIQWLDLHQNQQNFTLKLAEKPLLVLLDPDLPLFRQLAPNESPPILCEVRVHHWLSYIRTGCSFTRSLGTSVALLWAPELYCIQWSASD